MHGACDCLHISSAPVKNCFSHECAQRRAKNAIKYGAEELVLSRVSTEMCAPVADGGSVGERQIIRFVRECKWCSALRDTGIWCTTSANIDFDFDVASSRTCHNCVRAAGDDEGGMEGGEGGAMSNRNAEVRIYMQTHTLQSARIVLDTRALIALCWRTY